jgi:hypothetical protein
MRTNTTVAYLAVARVHQAAHPPQAVAPRPLVARPLAAARRLRAVARAHLVVRPRQVVAPRPLAAARQVHLVALAIVNASRLLPEFL